MTCGFFFEVEGYFQRSDRGYTAAEVILICWKRDVACGLADVNGSEV